MKKHNYSEDTDNDAWFAIAGEPDDEEVKTEIKLRNFLDQYYALPEEERTKEKIHGMLEDINGQIGNWIKNSKQQKLFEEDSKLAGWLVDNKGGAVIYDCNELSIQQGRT